MSFYRKMQLVDKCLTWAALLGLIVVIFFQQIDLTMSDLGRHLNNGREVWQNHSLLYTNAYSYTEPDFRFINHHWLYGVIVYQVYRLGGFPALTILNILVILAAFSLAFFIAVKKLEKSIHAIFKSEGASYYYLAALLSLPVVLLLSERVEVRPEIFSYLFIILTYSLLESTTAEQQYRRLWWLGPLFLLWVNIHIYFFIGLALLAFKALSVMINQSNWKAAWRSGRIWIMAGCASALVCLANPNTWRGLLYPLTIFNNYGYEIAENKSVFFLEHLMVDHNFLIFKAVFLLLTISWILYFVYRKKEGGNAGRNILGCVRRRSFDLLVTLFIGALALMASRNISLFGLVSLIIISANLAPILARYQKPIERQRVYILLGLGVLLIGTFAYLLSDARGSNRLIKNSFGLGLYSGNEASAEYFKQHNLSGPIFNNYDIGGALIFWLRPQELVFVDNRPEAYSNAFFNDVYKPLQSEADKWEEYSRVYNFKTIYFTHTDGTPWAQEFLQRILSDEKWVLVYLDEYTVILINKEKYGPAQTSTLSLDKWAIKSRIRELAVTANLKNKMHLAGLAQIVSLPELAEEIYQEILQADPGQAFTAFAFGSLYSNYGSRDNYLKAVSYFQAALDAGYRLPGVYNQLGLAQWQLGNYTLAQDAWEQALKRERHNVSALYYLNQVEELKKAGKLPAE